MTTFLTILFVLVCINAAMILTSLYNVNKSSFKTPKDITRSTISKIYPIDLAAPKYKKAV